MADTPPRDRTDDASLAPGESGYDVRELIASFQRLTGIGVWWYDVRAEEIWWSGQAKRVHGIDPERTPTLSDVTDRYTDTGAERVTERFEEATERPAPFVVDIGLTGEGTTERAIRLYCEPRVEEGETVALYGAVQDVTEVKRREQRIEILRETSQKLRGASSREEVAEIIADTAKNILGLVNTTVRLADEKNSTLQTVVATEECVERAGDRPHYSVDEETPAARTYRTGDPEIHADHDATEDDHDRGELRSGLYVPIGHHGVLSAGDVVVDAFEEHDLEAASLLGQLGAEAITRIGWVQRSRAV